MEIVEFVTQYPSVVHYDNNKLILPSGDSTRLLRFFSKLDSVMLFGSGRLNIVHIGGSHVQADGFSNSMRMHFASMQSNAVASRGAFFPWSAAKTNGPWNLVTSHTGTWKKTQNSLGVPEHDMGIMGYAITTSDTNASISFELNPERCTNRTNWKFNRLRLFAKMDDSITTPLLDVDSILYEGVRMNDCYIFILPFDADHGTLRFRHDSTIIDSTKMVRPFELTIEGIIPENDRNGIVYHALGVNGAAVKSWLKCNDFENQLQYIAPDLLICGIGINDANVPYASFNPEDYKEQYKQLLDRIYNINPDCAVIFLTNNDCALRLRRKNKGANKNTPRVEQALMELALEQDAAVWDQYMIMGGMGSSVDWVKAGLMHKDRVHFTAAGYDVMGDLLFDALMRFKWNY